MTNRSIATFRKSNTKRETYVILSKRCKHISYEEVFILDSEYETIYQIYYNTDKSSLKIYLPVQH